MNMIKAVTIARKQAKQWDEERYIVDDDGDYAVSTEIELDGFFLGCKVKAVVLPDGEILN